MKKLWKTCGIIALGIIFLIGCGGESADGIHDIRPTAMVGSETDARVQGGGDHVQGRRGQTYCLTHSNSLSNKMGNSLLAVRGINHKYIVVGEGEHVQGEGGPVQSGGEHAQSGETVCKAVRESSCYWER